MARRGTRWLAALLLAPALVMVLAVWLFWLWAGREGSLATTLRLAGAMAAPALVLQADNVQGSLRAGGDVTRLRVQTTGWQAELSELRLRWQPLALLEGHLQIDTLAADALRVQVVADDSPAQAPPQLTLPFDVTLPLAIQQLVLDGTVPAQARDITLQYTYRRNVQQHRVQLDQAHWADGRYQGQAVLQALAPMALDVQLGAQVTTAIPGSPHAATLEGRATLTGTLAEAGTLPLVLSLQVQTAGQSARRDATHATLNARLDPWAMQPVRDAHAAWNGLDLAAWWPGAPRTRLAGQLSLRPDAAPGEWSAQIGLTNHTPGPWNLHQLPVASLSLDARLRSDGSRPPEVTVHRLHARAAGGDWQANGRWQPRSAQPWQGEVALKGADPAALWDGLPSAALDGNAQAQGAGDGVAFTLALQSAATPKARATTTTAPGVARPTPLPVALKAASARGHYEAGTLTLERWQVQAGALQAEGQARVQVAARRGDARLVLQAPGLQLRMQGSSAPQSGTGTVALKVDDAAQAQRALMPWITPWLKQPVPALDGALQLDANWQGGWAQPDALRLAVQLAAPRLRIGTGVEDALALQAVTLQARGTLASTTAQLRGSATRGGWRGQVETALRGGQQAGQWQAQLQSLQLQLHPPGTANASAPPWHLALAAPVAVRWRHAAGIPTAELDAGEALLRGPASGTATLAWQPLRAGFSPTGLTLDSSGQLRDLPLNWIELSGQRLQDMGLAGGDLRFEGQWTLRMADALHLQASLSRRSGDLQLLADDGSGQPVLAGVREATVRLQADGEQVRTELVWNTQNAGQVQAQLHTRVVRGADGWRWPADAPLQGTLRANLPRMAAWSVLAPPGWRVQGTLDAQATIAGTRAQPQWSGTLNADDLALHAVLEGIALRGGRLRTRFDGPRLDIDEFSLRGAGDQGGRLNVSGYAQWLPATGAGAGLRPGLARVRIDLLARAEALRAGDRADRRLTVSGEVRTLLADEKLQVRGALKADHARLVLPDEGTPSLGSDVVVRRGPAGPQRTTEPASGRAVRVSPDLAVTLDLGDDFQVQGRGLRTRLAGALTLTLDGGAAPQAMRLRGEIRTDRGTFRAYQQQLTIDKGLLRFNGPWDNPVLDIIAIRPNLPQRAGVQVSGTALAPRIRLYSEPLLSDAETLAWVLLGRAAAAGATESAMLQQALLAMLGNRLPSPGGALADLLGLDDIARNFYVTYERSVAGTLGTLYIFYDLSRRITLRAQAGAQSAVDLIFTLPYD